MSSPSTMISSHDEHIDARFLESNPNKRRKIDTTSNPLHQSSNNNHNNHNQIRWRSLAEQQTYSSKLIAALRHIRCRNSTTSPPVSTSRAVREAADNALAIAAKGRTCWSRAILMNRMKLRLKNHKKAKVRSKLENLPPLSTAVPKIDAGEMLTTVEERVKVLGRLVPGCRKLSFPNLLEEATDYIAALQMQIRTMTALTELLSGSNSSSSAGLMDIEPASRSHDNDDIIMNSDHDNPVQ